MNNSIVFVNISKRRNSSELCLIPVHDIAGIYDANHQPALGFREALAGRKDEEGNVIVPSRLYTADGGRGYTTLILMKGDYGYITDLTAKQILTRIAKAKAEFDNNYYTESKAIRAKKEKNFELMYQ